MIDAATAIDYQRGLATLREAAYDAIVATLIGVALTPAAIATAHMR